MQKKLLAFLIVVMIMSLCFALVGCDSDSFVGPTYASDTGVTTVQATSADQVEQFNNQATADGLTAKVLNTLSMSGSAYYYLDQDWTDSTALTKSLTINCGDGTVYLDLRGFDISVASGLSVITVSSGTLVLFDSVGGGTVTGASQSNNLGGGGVYVAAGAVLDLYDGVSITGNATATSTYLGGGVYNAGVFYMHGGAVSDNHSEGIGGGVYNIGVFNMSGGTISGNTIGASKYGAGVYNAGIFTMSGGTITDNTSTLGGGGVSNVGTMTMSGGSITDNTAGGAGGGIFVGAGSTLTINGGELSGNSSSSGGGAISITGEGSTVTIQGADIVDNTAGVVGGAIYYTKGTLIISGNTDITDNTASSGTTSNIYVAEGQEIVVTGEVTGTIGVTYAGESGTIVAGENYTITENTAMSFVSDSDDVYAVWSQEDNNIVIEGEAVIEVADDDTIIDGEATYVYGATIDVSTLFDSNSSDVTYTVATVSGSATLVGTKLNVNTVGTFVVTASAEATLTSAAAKGVVTITVIPQTVYISDITALNRGVNENNFYVDLEESSGTVVDIYGNAIAGISIDYSSAYGAIDNRDYYNDETLNSVQAYNTFAVTVYNVKLSGTGSANYVIADTTIATTVIIYTGYPLVSWPTVSDITYGETIGNSSLVGGKVMLKVGDSYITVSGSFVWVETPTAEDVGSYSHTVQFVVDDYDTDDVNYATIVEYKNTIESLTHYVSYSINPAPVTFDISGYVIEVDSDSEPTITATSNGATVSEDDYTILYFIVDGGVVYYSFDGSDEGDGSVDNPYKIDTTTSGTYCIGAELSDNYHHSGTVENTAKQIGVLYIAEDTSDVATYTVTFVDATGTTTIQTLTGYTGDIIVMPSNDDGIGWENAKGVFYEFGDRYAQPAYNETFTLVSASTNVTISGTVTGTDLDGTSGGLEGIAVQLMQGSTIVANTTTDSNGEYSFTVPAGSYNLVVTRSLTGLTNIVTVMVEAETDTIVDEIVLPSIRSNVVLDVYAGFTDITADNLEDLIVEGEYNTITIYVDKAETNGTEQTAILELAQQAGLTTSNVKLYFDINFTEQPDATEIALTELDSPVTFYIPLAGIYQHKDSYVVYVYDYNGNVYELTEGVDFTCDGENLTITTKIAGVYALAFTDEVETFDGDNDTTTYSSATFDLDTLFDDKGYNIAGATYTLDSSSTGVGTINGSLLTVESVGDFVIIITTLENDTQYSAIGTATLTVEPAKVTITGVTGVERGLEDDNVVVDIDTSGATIDGIINGDSITLNFNNAYGVIVEDKNGNIYYYTYDEYADEWTNQTKNFNVLIVGAQLVGSDSGNYIIDYSYTTVDITTSIPHVSWPTATDILYGQDLSSSTLYGGVVVVYDGGDYIEFSTDDCEFEWSSTTTYIDDFGNPLDINQLSAGTYTQKVTVSIKSTATGYDAEYNEILADYSYYVTFEIVADAVAFTVDGNDIDVGGSGTPTITATTGSGVVIDPSAYEIVYFIVDGGVKYYSFSGSEDGDGSYENPYKIDTTTAGTYCIGALFNLSDDGIYNYHHSGSLDSTAKQIGTLYITNDTVATYDTTFSVGGTVDGSLTLAPYSGDILVLPTLDGDTYIGWSYNGITYSFGARFTQPAYDVTFEAVEAPETYTVSGTITGVPLGSTTDEISTISGVGVALYQGSTLVAITSTDSNGYYSFDVAAGSYSLVITRTQGVENIITIYLSVTGTTDVGTTEIPNIRQNTVVSVDTGVENVTVEGLDDLHTDDEENTFTITVSDGSSNVVVLDDIQSTASDYGITNEDMKVFLDISITDDSGNIIELADGQMLTFYITLAGAYQGYDNYYVYRYHTAADGTVTVEKITVNTNEYGESIAISADGSTLILNICRFSIIGIAFQDDFTVTFGDSSSDYEYGSDIIAPTTTPTKESTAQYSYTFAGWSLTEGGTVVTDFGTVTGDATYYAVFTATTNEYTVTFDTQNGTTVTGSTQEFGTDITKPAEDPTKASTVEFRYEFAGWFTASEGGEKVTEFGTVGGDVTYYAQYTAITRTYTVTITAGSNGSVNVTTIENVPYGSVIAVSGNVITINGTSVTATAATDTDAVVYAFGGWSVVDGETTTNSTAITVTFSDTAQQYIYTFYDEDGSTVLGTATVDYDTVIVVPSTTPAKSATVQYTYTFAGWYSALTDGAVVTTFGNVTANVSYYAQYTATTNSYTVTWYDEGGTTELYSADFLYGATPVYGADDPVKSATSQYTYAFDGWSMSAVTGDASYTATYTATINSYVVTFDTQNGTTVTGSTLDFDTDITAPESNPTKDSTDEFSYQFAGWFTASEGGDKVTEFGTVGGDVTYYAQYTESKRTYTVAISAGSNGSVDVTTIESVPYGTTITVSGNTITIGDSIVTATVDSNTAKYTYAFASWSVGDGDTTDDSTTITASFTATINRYTVTFGDSRSSLSYGSDITAPTTTPTKDSTAQYSYTFAGWSLTEGGDKVIDFGTVSGDATYYALFTEIIRSYTVAFGDSSSSLSYGSDITAPTSNPTKDSTAQYSYTFAGWSLTEGGTVVADFGTVTADTTYYAVFTAVTNSYTVTFDVDGVTTEQTVQYGATATFESPTKDDYTFAGWIDEDDNAFALTTPITEAITLTATWTVIEDSTDDDDVVTDDGETDDDVVVGGGETDEDEGDGQGSTDAGDDDDATLVSLWWVIVILLIVLTIEILLIRRKLNKRKANKGTRTYSMALLALAFVVPVGEIITIIVLVVACVVTGVVLAEIK